MPNDSTTAGYLLPTSTAPSADLDLDKILQHIIVGLTGLPGNMVRPRWQPTNPKQPEANANWCAVGVTNVKRDANSTVIHDPTGDGSDTLIRHEKVEALASFCGPQGQQYAEVCRDGFWIPQNNAMLRQYDAGFTDAGDIRSVPELVNQQWRRRYDLAFTIRRKVTRTYNVRNIESVEIVIQTDDPAMTETIEVANE
jgi:hypothetical protein